MNALQTLVDSPVIERLGWTLLHSVWQGLAVAIVLALCLPLLRRRGARASYGACCGALLLSVFLPAMTYCLLPEPQRPVTMPGASMPERSQPVASEPTPAARPIPSMAIAPLDDFARDGFDRAPKEQSRTAPSAGQQASIAQPAKSVSSPRRPPHRSSSPPASVPAASWIDRGAALGDRLRDRLSQWMAWIVLVWSVGVLGLSLWNVGGWFAARRLKKSGTIPAPVAIQRAAVRIAEQLGLTRGVRLLQSALVDSPVVIGAFKPVILLPASLVTEIPTDQLESLLAHELAHVLRHDYLVNLIQSRDRDAALLSSGRLVDFGPGASRARELLRRPGARRRLRSGRLRAGAGQRRGCAPFASRACRVRRPTDRALAANPGGRRSSGRASVALVDRRGDSLAVRGGDRILLLLVRIP